MKCPVCGSEMDSSTRYCPVCGELCDGTNVNDSNDQPEVKKSRYEKSEQFGYEDLGTQQSGYEDSGSYSSDYEVFERVKKKRKKKSYKIPIIAGVALAAVIGLTWTLSAKLTTKKIHNLTNNSDASGVLEGNGSDSQKPSEEIQDETEGLNEVEPVDYSVALIVDHNDENRIKIVDGFNAICDGKDCEYFFASDHQEQVEIVEECRDSGLDAIIVELIDPVHAGEIALAARDMPVVFVNRYPDTESVLKEGKVAYVGPDYYDIGVMQGVFLTDYFEKSGKDTLTSVGIYSDTVSSDTVLQYSGYCDALEYAGIEESWYSMQALSADNRRAAHEALKDTFARLLKFLDLLDCVVTETDRMALGVIDCLEDYGLEATDIPIVSSDLTVDGLQAIKDGKLDMSVYIDYKLMAETAAVAAINLIEGDPLNTYLESEAFEFENETTIWFPCWPVIAENADDFVEYLY
ncbi:MAG: substrate-binding domain-containing protein [Lachnospiraceae bacterium]|nr:substrate-binding domain-containing protein [Lachnospiraceae bacterium]